MQTIICQGGMSELGLGDVEIQYYNYCQQRCCSYY